MTVTKRFAQYIYEARYEDIPHDVHRYARLCLLDWIGVTLGGSREPISDILMDFVDIVGGNPHATIIGKGIKTNLIFAALVNGTLSHALDFDDTHKNSGTHPSVCLAPAVMAVGEYMKSSGQDLITAFVTGFEVGARIGEAAGTAHYDYGWHATATIGRFSATAAASKLMGLSQDQIVNAFGIAGTQVSGLREVFGTMSKPFHAGKAAMDGLLSVALAKRNFDSSNEIFEGKFGLKNVFAPKADPSGLLKNLGRKYHITDIAFKPYASALATHSTIQAIEAMKAKEKITAEDVKSIQIEFGQLPFSVVNIKHPRRVMEGKFSVYQCAALAFVKGRVTPGMFTHEWIKDPEIIRFREKVTVLLNPGLKKFETIIKVITQQGRILEIFIRESKGSSSDPLTFLEMKNKFMDLALPVVDIKNAEKIVESVRHLSDIQDIGAIIQLCHPAEDY
jgi:2-methylcitrate dehydratase PrpD